MDEAKQRERQLDHYKKTAEIFDVKERRADRCHRNKIILISQALNLKPDEVVLEVGVGTGIHARWLLEAHDSFPISFIGCDLSPEMIGQAKKRLDGLPNVSLLVAAGENLPLADASVDKAYISGSLHHFGNFKKGVKELVRVVKPGGVIAISEPNIFCPLNFVMSLALFGTESGMFLSHPGAIRRLFLGLPVEMMHRKIFNFTPSFPESAGHIFDKIDRFMNTIPLIRYLGSMSITVVKRL